MERTDNVNIKQFKPLITPAELKQELPQNEQTGYVVAGSRRAIQKILANNDDRRIVITGPCSLHDVEATVDYAGRLGDLQQQVAEKILIVMRAYFEKPRTRLGWKGMIYDPHLDNSYDIEEGLRKARGLMLEIAKAGVAAATEFLDPVVPQYLADLVSWAAIGARTTESQIHRQMASGLSMPVGFKNATDGSLTAAVDAVRAAASPHSFMGIDHKGCTVIAETRGNPYCHVVLRGGSTGPNYESEYVAFAEVLLKKASVPTGIIIDCSHANSNKEYTRQPAVADDVAAQIRAGNSLIAGIMLESFINEGKQSFDRPENLEYGLSLTDACIGWDKTRELILRMAEA